MENQGVHYNKLKHVDDTIKANAIFINNQFERQRQLRAEADSIFARMDLLIDIVR